MRKIVFATNNLHKLREARELAGDDFEILSLADIGCHEDLPETMPDIEGNSAQKAAYVKEHYGHDCFADDTGLFVDALDGAPGVYSARYAGPGCTPADNVAKLLDEMKGVDRRTARFRTVVTFCHGPKPTAEAFEGAVEGIIALQPSGNGGFGYDPVFIPEEAGVSFAEMSSDQKNSISHRGRAMRKFFDFLRNL